MIGFYLFFLVCCFIRLVWIFDYWNDLKFVFRIRSCIKLLKGVFFPANSLSVRRYIWPLAITEAILFRMQINLFKSWILNSKCGQTSSPSLFSLVVVVFSFFSPFYFRQTTFSQVDNSDARSETTDNHKGSQVLMQKSYNNNNNNNKKKKQEQHQKFRRNNNNIKSKNNRKEKLELNWAHFLLLLLFLSLSLF